MDTVATLQVLAPVLGTLGALAPLARWGYRRMAAMSTTITALQRAVELHDAQSRGVVLVVTYPDHPRSAIPLLRQTGWTVCGYAVAVGEDLPDSAQFRADLACADVVLLQGASPEQNAHVAKLRWFRDGLASGAGVVMYVPTTTTRYDQGLWGDGDQSSTTPATTEAAVRATVARRRQIAALQGVRPGGLAAARQQLVGGNPTRAPAFGRVFVGDETGDQV